MSDTQAHQPSRDLPQSIASARPKQVSLLFVDDDGLIRDLMVEGLRHKGFHVIPAEDGPAALAALAAGQPIDLMITDYSMPEMTGLDLIRQVRITHPTLPVFLLTGYADDQVAQTLVALTDGNGVLLHKPIRLQDLVNRINAAFSGGG